MKLVTVWMAETKSETHVAFLVEGEVELALLGAANSDTVEVSARGNLVFVRTKDGEPVTKRLVNRLNAIFAKKTPAPPLEPVDEPRDLREAVATNTGLPVV